MKTAMSLALALVFASASNANPLPVNSNQPVTVSKFTNEFARFNVHRQQKGVVLNWIFTDPNNVVSFVVQRSYDGEFYENIAETPSNGKNQHKDNDVFPGHIYYRIAALMFDGSTIYSNVDVVRIVRNG